MISVTKQDIDAACAAYGRATGDYPRREGIRTALHSYRQMEDRERALVHKVIISLQDQQRAHDSSMSERSASNRYSIDAGETARVLQKLLGLTDAEPERAQAPQTTTDETPVYGKMTGGYYGG